MPSLFMIGSYRVFFWSNENGEPIHVHVCIGIPNKNASKFWLTKGGHCVIADNASHISPKELNKIIEILEANYFFIVRKWKEFFLEEPHFIY